MLIVSSDITLRGEKPLRKEGHRSSGSMLRYKAQKKRSPGEVKAPKLPTSLMYTGLCD